jgi:hypothetical protein
MASTRLCSSPELSPSHPVTPNTHKANPSLFTLPPELHLLIFTHLPWPDLLALKHAHPYFYVNIPTTVRQRVSWLLSRAPCGLGLPQEKVNMKTDADFCCSHEIRTFLERRRWHLDCKWDGKQCMVFDGGRCPEDFERRGKGSRLVTKRKNRRSWWGQQMFSKASIGVLGVLGVLLGMVVALILNSQASITWMSGTKEWYRGLVPVT